MLGQKAITIESNNTPQLTSDVLQSVFARSCGIDLPQIQGLSHGGKWALAPDALRFLVGLVEHLRPRHILELGSGFSTYLLSRVGATLESPCHITSIDHDPEFGDATIQKLKELGTDHLAKVQIAPLVVRACEGKMLPMYHLQLTCFASQHPPELVLIDGPPKALGGREGTLYQVMEFARVGTLVLLDDADRREEQAAIDRWRTHFGRAIEVNYLPGFTRGMAVIIIREPVPLVNISDHQLRQAGEDIAEIIPRGDNFILVDDNQWDKGKIAMGRHFYPFLERGGEYWGPPPDDVTAIAELQRLRRSGANFIVFGWPSFWWFDYYPGLFSYLRGSFRCVLENGRLTVFDLRP